MTYCTIRVASVAYETSASIDPNLDEATPMYERAMRIDDENPEAPYFLGLRLIDRGNYEQAATYLKRSIAIGKARSADFSYLASAQALSGDNRGAEETFAQAAAMYPQSPFVLTRYAALLSANGKASESKLQLNRAIQIDPKQAGTWWTMLTDSPQAAADTAFQSHYYTPLMDLRPQMSMYAVKAEREIRHPEEKLKF
jgi:tetratricopeptide (TPR) repeat protein